MLLNIRIEKARNINDIEQVKNIADEHRYELGFHSIQSYIDSLNKNELIVAKEHDKVIGFVRYHHRKDNKTTLYEIATKHEVRGKGVGRQLIDFLASECENFGSRYIRLSCPVSYLLITFIKWLGLLAQCDAV